MNWIYLATTSLTWFYNRWEALRAEGKTDLRWFSIGKLYFICNTPMLTEMKQKFINSKIIQ